MIITNNDRRRGLVLQDIALVISAAGIIFTAGVFLFVFFNSKKDEEYAPIQRKWYKVRTVWFVVLIALIMIASAGTLRQLPYFADPEIRGYDITRVDVEAFQYGWEMSQLEFEVGERYEFHVTSRDVNHGFGIYNEDAELLTQVQAMPDYTNVLYHTFEEPGTYEILCMEYCGIAHHMMITEIFVREPGGSIDES